MASGIEATINKIARLFNKWILFGLTLIITIMLFGGGNRTVLMSIWGLFIFLSSIFSINAILLKRGFNKEINRLLKAGKPIKGIDGFEELVASLNSAGLQSYIITLSAMISFGFFILGDTLKQAAVGLQTLAVTMAFISISITFLVDYPEDPSLTPGGLVGFYEPDTFPLIIDNLLSDVFLAYLDPVTLMAFDDWSAGLLGMLDPSFEDDEDQDTRLERAREKVLLMAYLGFSNPQAFPEEVVYSELRELVGDNLDNFVNGVGVGLTWQEIQDVIRRIESRAPEPFRLVDKLMIELTDNYHQFTKGDLYFTVGARSNQGSVTESSGIIAFFINTTTKEDRDIKVWYRTDRQSIHPDYQEVNITLDILTDPFPEEEPPLIADNGTVDVLTLLSSLLQVGDAVWFRLQPKGFGYRVVTVFAEEEAEEGDRSPTMGRSFEMRFTKSIGWYIKSFAPKLSALGGVALPFLRSAFGF